MKDIDDIYDMENYDSDDSPGEYVIAEKYITSTGYVWHGVYCTQA